jgi:hypothetical protein
MTCFGWVMATYFSAMATVGAAFVKPRNRPAKRDERA